MAVDLYNWATGKADIEQVMLELSEQTGIEMKDLVLMDKMLGIDDAVLYAKE